jgi:single-stranded DNA-binding protein
MNQVALVGNITDDPELRYTQSGAALAGFTVAVSHRSKHVILRPRGTPSAGA